MPELPEVETVRRGLTPAMEGAVIAQADVNRPDLRWPFPERMANRLTGARVLRLRRRAKYILADLDTGETLLIHLGMSGRMLVSDDPLGQFVHDHPAPEKHDHVVFHMDNGARITFNDPRRFGAMDLMQTAGAETHKLLSVLGPEPLGNDFHESHLIEAFRGRMTPVKSALLDQKIVSGLGNIYVDESLWLARIHPLTLSNAVPAAKVRKLHAAIQEVLQKSIDANGTSFMNFKFLGGYEGGYTDQLLVFSREGQPCLGCKGTIVKLKVAQRGTHICPKCQKA